MLDTAEARAILRNYLRSAGVREASLAFLARLHSFLRAGRLGFNTGNLGNAFHTIRQARPLETFVGTPGETVNENIFRLTLTWNQANDIDLHVWAPGGEHSWYGHQAISMGELDFDDTDGIGPEHFTSRSLVPGRYYIGVNYYSGSPATEYLLNVAEGTQSVNRSYTLTAPNHNGGYPVTGTTASWWRVADLIVGEDGSVQVVDPDATPLNPREAAVEKVGK